MKTRLLPLVALISATACSSVFAASNAYVTDSNGNMVTDSYGSCVRSIDWTADKAIDSCENPVKKEAAHAPMKASSPAKASMTAPALIAPVKSDIQGNEKKAYVVDSYGNIVRDGYGYCVRTIDWSKDTAIAKCEGWAEPKPVVVSIPKPVPVVVPVVVEEVVVVVEEVKEDAPAAFRGFFDTNKADLKENAMDELNTYSDYMKRNQDTRVKVTGHTDSMGNDTYNQMLSEKRAIAVKSYLEGSGIAADRIEATGMGESQPVASNKTKEGRAENRRVELEIIK